MNALKTFKSALIFSIFAALASSSFASFKTLTNKEGKSAILKLVSKETVKGKIVAKFKTSKGVSVTINEADLSDESVKILKAWTPDSKKSSSNSVYSELFDGNLLKLENKKLPRTLNIETPEKYYIFYYTASWCGPCKRFTPSLVKFYNQNKNDNFEIILITSDSDLASMENYASTKKMTWPHLKLSKVQKFKKMTPNPTGGIPAIKVTDLEGKTIVAGNAYEILPKLKKLVSK